MDDDAMERWPRFELVRYSAPTGIPNEWDAELLEKGMPKGMMGRYRAAKKLTQLEDTDRGPLVVFGKEGRFQSVCLDPQTSQVVDVTYVDVATPNLPAGVIGPTCVVNSTLDQFIGSMRAVIGSFPFDDGSVVLTRDSTDAEDDEIQRLTDQAVEDLRGLSARAA